jgi:hypothetical protein
VEFVATTVNVDEPPKATEVGFAVMLTLGARIALTVTVAVAEVFPPGPVTAAV